MADLAIGISKTAVQALVEKVQTAIKEEGELWQVVQRDTVFITEEFEMMQSFLNSADGERIKNNVVRTWVRQVRNLSYDVEDCIELVLHLDTTRSRWAFLLRMVPTCLKSEAPQPLDEAVAEIKLLKDRVIDVSQRNIRYNLIGDSGSKPFTQIQQTAPTNARAVDTLINGSMKRRVWDLTALITREEHDLQVISLCGTGGELGKISIIREVYGDSRICEQFECRAWVKLMHPFNGHEFIRSLVAQFYTNSSKRHEGAIAGVDFLKTEKASQGDDLLNEFVQKIDKQRYLIILEDLSSMGQWDAIMSYLPDIGNGSRIVVLASQIEIASLCPGQPCRVSEIREFSAGHSIFIFFKEILQNYRWRIPSVKIEVPCHSISNVALDIDKLLGRADEVDELFQQTREHGLISVWGLPGVGKSVLVRAVYQRHKTCPWFRKHGFVKLSYSFNPMDFARELLLSMSSEQVYSNAFPSKDYIKECQNLLREYDCLVIIDGLLSKEEWDWIKSNLVTRKSGSCIIITTSEESVAKYCAVSSNDAVYKVKGLSDADAEELFQKVHMENRSNISFLTDNQEEEAERILSKCGGLPFVIVTLAKYLATRPQDMLEQEMRRLNANFMQELETNPEFDSLRGLLAWMHSYVHACPQHLKTCMLYLSIFPQYCIIQRRRLVRRWIAEGYSRGTDSNSLKEHAEKLFDELTTLGILQPVQRTTKVVGYQVNGFFREYIVSRPVEEKLFFPLEVSVLEDENSGRLATEAVGQHLAIGDLDRSPDFFDSFDLSRLRSLTVFGYMWSFISDQTRMGRLRVLDLENATNVEDDDLGQIGNVAPNLKFLSLRGHRRIKCLPDSFSNLNHLQSLDIRDTSIVTLPQSITKLQWLRYIRAGTSIPWTDLSMPSEERPVQSSSRSRTLVSCLPKFRRRGPVGSSSNGVDIPRWIHHLKFLHTLGSINVNREDVEDILRHIYWLDQLKKLEFSGINSKNSKHLSIVIRTFETFESLSLEFEKDNNADCLKHISFPEDLRSLKMYGYLVNLPDNFKNLDNLVKLSLDITRQFTPEDMKVIGSLRNLSTLRLRVKKDQDGRIRFDQNFGKLKVLEIACNSRLQVEFDEGAVDKLEQLKLYCCDGSSLQLSGLEHLSSLRKVWLMGSFDDTAKEAVKQQLDNHPKKPTLELKN